MIRHVWLAAAGIVAAGAPLLPSAAPVPSPALPWPATFEGRRLTPLPAGPGDAMLAKGFPGRIARFGDGRRQIVLRQVSRATRQLHPARTCFAGLGYAIAPLPMRPVAGGYASCFAATRKGSTLHVCEHIRDARGRVFADAPGWYWPALLGTSAGPWLAAMTVEHAK